MQNKSISIWLYSCCLMVLLMVFVGGITRLTESGLSITEWQVFKGIFPPFNQADWLVLFEKYKLSPEFAHKNFTMTVEEFKNIFWLEFIHRILGRITGFVFLIPYLYFLFTKKISKEFAVKFFGIILLVGLQGLAGWLMVKSGLKENPYVNPAWLMTHLLMALLIFSLVLWQALNFTKTNPIKKPLITKLSFYFIALTTVQIALGALVAGSDAGLIYNSFPDMNGQYLPDDLWNANIAWYANFVENRSLIQFLHRIGAYLVTLYALFYCYLLFKEHKIHSLLLLATVTFQVTIGILVLLLQVPIFLASIHQLIAFILFAQIIILVYKSCR